MSCKNYDVAHDVIYTINVLKVVIDTNFVVAALQSRTGASNAILRQLGLTFTYVYSNAFVYSNALRI
jgi:rRNA-processing protein FCF1